MLARVSLLVGPKGATRTGLVVRTLPRLLPGEECSKGLTCSQGIQFPYEVILPVSRSLQPRFDTLPRSHKSREQGDPAIKRTFQPKKRYRRRVHGFLRRMSARGGVRVVQNRRRKGRLRLSS